ncbi:MAG: Do family serine endopeptidase, partial [Proteobacteria bacterium]|nr:Do family serine endopeptidase [Pseudomonadota bacterium]
MISTGIRTKKAKQYAVGAAVLTAILAGGAVGGYLAQPSAASAANGSQVAERPQMPRSFADVVERVSPAVVNVQVSSRAAPRLSSMSGPTPQGPDAMREFFEKFFNDGQGGGKGGDEPRSNDGKRMGAGSGFIVDATGHIVTNDHVIRGADKITVTFVDGKTADAHLVGRDPKTDLALLKVDTGKSLPFVNFGDSDKLRVGDWVMTVGNPFGLGHSVNVGVVSARGRTIGAGPYDDFLQIDAPINPGNSGGPAFDVAGNVIGVNSAIFSPNGGNVGIGFAIPASITKQVVDDLKSKGTVERGWLGVSIQSVTQEIAEGVGLKEASGALIAEVDPSGPAAAAGLKSGDVVLSVDGKTAHELRDLTRAIACIEPGHESKLEIWRNGARLDIAVKIAKMPATKDIAATDGEAADDTGLGISASTLDKETASRLGLPENTKGVVIAGVKPGGAAAEKG